MVQDIFTQVHQACHELGIALVGGHTEITVGLERPILSGHMLGEVTHEHLVTSAGVQGEDAILLTKGFPVEGVSIIAQLDSLRSEQLEPYGSSRYSHGSSGPSAV